MKDADLRLKRENALREDDRKRDEMEIDVYMKAAELEAKYGAQLNAEQIKKSAAIAKEVMKAQADMVKEAVRGEENQGANPNGRPRG